LQIRRLEREIGTSLLRRETRGVKLTETGALLLEEARRILGQVEGGASGPVLQRLIPNQIASPLAGLRGCSLLASVSVTCNRIIERGSAACPYVKLRRYALGVSPVALRNAVVNELV
jgi:hypothetical protein